MIPRVLASTTSHKREPLLPAIEVLGRLGLQDLDLNLHHVLELGTPVADIRRAADRAGVRIWVVSGGWCDFFHPAPAVDDSFHSVQRQVAIAEAFDTAVVRLFFGRLPPEAYSAAARNNVCANLLRLSDRHPAARFVFENHDGVSLRPDVCAEILARVDRPNIRMNFDPINFERVGVDSLGACAILAPFVGHVHLKGLDHGEYCEFGEGEIDLTPVLRALLDQGYAGAFSIEYEGPFDKTLRLYRSVGRARDTLARLGA